MTAQIAAYGWLVGDVQSKPTSREQISEHDPRAVAPAGRYLSKEIPGCDQER